MYPLFFLYPFAEHPNFLADLRRSGYWLSVWLVNIVIEINAALMDWTFGIEETPGVMKTFAALVRSRPLLGVRVVRLLRSYHTGVSIACGRACLHIYLRNVLVNLIHFFQRTLHHFHLRQVQFNSKDATQDVLCVLRFVMVTLLRYNRVLAKHISA